MRFFGLFCKRGIASAAIAALTLGFVLQAYLSGGQFVLAASEYLSTGTISWFHGLTITVVCAAWLLLPLKLLHIL